MAPLEVQAPQADTVRLDRGHDNLEPEAERASGSLPALTQAPRATPFLEAVPQDPPEKTAKLPSRKLSPVITEAEERVWPDATPDVEVLRPTSRYAPSSRILVEGPALGDEALPDTELRQRQAAAGKRSWLTWTLVACAVLGAVVGALYMTGPTQSAPPAASAPVPVPTPVVVEKASPPAPPVEPVAAPEPAPAPSNQAVAPETAAVADERPAPKAITKGVLEIVAMPYAKVTLSGRNLGDVQGKKRVSLAPGTYVLTFTHPKRSDSRQATVKAGRTEIVEFSAF